MTQNPDHAKSDHAKSAPGFLLTIALRAANARERSYLGTSRKSQDKPCSHWTLTQKVRDKKIKKMEGEAKKYRKALS